MENVQWRCGTGARVPPASLSEEFFAEAGLFAVRETPCGLKLRDF
jgi:hypothetical protein